MEKRLESREIDEVEIKLEDDKPPELECLDPSPNDRVEPMNGIVESTYCTQTTTDSSIADMAEDPETSEETSVRERSETLPASSPQREHSPAIVSPAIPDDASGPNPPPSPGTSESLHPALDAFLASLSSPTSHSLIRETLIEEGFTTDGALDLLCRADSDGIAYLSMRFKELKVGSLDWIIIKDGLAQRARRLKKD